MATVIRVAFTHGDSDTGGLYTWMATLVRVALRHGDSDTGGVYTCRQ